MSGANLTDCSFSGAAFADVDLTGTTIKGADFVSVDAQFEIRDAGTRYEGVAALGLLRARGARTADVDPIHVLRHHAKFDVAVKVAAKLTTGAPIWSAV